MAGEKFFQRSFAFIPNCSQLVKKSWWVTVSQTLLDDISSVMENSYSIKNAKVGIISTALHISKMGWASLSNTI
jgi:hypothetical protein